MRGFRSKRLAAYLFAVTAGMLAGTAVAQSDAYPERPVRLLVGFSAGGPTDVIARVFQNHMSEALGQPLVVENRPGTGGNIAAEMLARAEPDGYTIMLGSPGQLAVNKYLYTSIPYDPARDFAPVAQITSGMLNLVVPAKSPHKSLKDLLDYARKNPNGLAYGSAGNGSTMHIGGEMLQVMADVTMLHVPYRGSAAANVDLLAGRLDFMIDSQSTTVPHIKSGDLRLLAVTGAERSDVFPHAPTVAEAGVDGYELTTWLGVVAPAGTPKPIIDRLAKAFAEVGATPEVQKHVNDLGSSLKVTDPGAFAVHLDRERQRAERVIREAGISLN